MANKTSENLVKAFAGESQAYQRYVNFAAKAELEGHEQVAKMFRAAAEGEKIHAALHFNTVGGVRTTEENLRAAISGETEEFTHMYPEMIKDAQSEEEKKAETRFAWANEVEKKHAAEYSRLLENLGAVENVDYFVCQICGNLEIGQVLANCPVCGAPAEKFLRVS